MVTDLEAVEIYRETLERTRREAEEALTAAINGLVGQHIRISGKSEETAGVVRSVIPDSFSRPLHFTIELVDGAETVVKAFFFPNTETISVVEGS